MRGEGRRHPGGVPYGVVAGILAAILCRPLGLLSLLIVAGAAFAAWRFGSHTSPARLARGRLEFLDAARGIAALMVAADHVLEVHDPALFTLVNAPAYWGNVGVLLFFAISGFIIPATLEREGSPWAFPVNRAFRILPLYLVTFAAALAVRFLVPGALTPGIAAHPALTILASLTLTTFFLNIEAILPLSWTLGVEGFFYAFAWLLRRAGLLVRTPALVLVGAALLIVQAVRGGLAGTNAGAYLLAWTLLFLVGTLVYRHASGGERGLRALGPIAAALAVIPAVFLYQAPLAGLTAVGSAATNALFAAGLFGLFYLGRARAWPGALTWLGRMSYGLYLWHGVLLFLVPRGWPYAPAFLAIVGGGLALAALTFRFVEEPMVAYGRRLAGRLPAGAV